MVHCEHTKGSPRFSRISPLTYISKEAIGRPAMLNLLMRYPAVTTVRNYREFSLCWLCRSARWALVAALGVLSIPRGPWTRGAR